MDSSRKAFDVDLGKHGDTALGEVKALEALLEGQADAGLLSKMMWTRGLEGQLPIDKAKLQEDLVLLPEVPLKSGFSFGGCNGGRCVM